MSKHSVLPQPCNQQREPLSTAKPLICPGPDLLLTITRLKHVVIPVLLGISFFFQLEKSISWTSFPTYTSGYSSCFRLEPLVFFHSLLLDISTLPCSNAAAKKIKCGGANGIQLAYFSYRTTQRVLKVWMSRLLLTRTSPTIARDASILCCRSPAVTTLLPSSARRWARQRTRRGSRADLWTCSTSSCRRTRGADSAAMTTTSRTCRDPSWSDRWPKSAWWGRNWGGVWRGRLEGIMNGGREGVTGMHPVIAGSAPPPFFFS